MQENISTNNIIHEVAQFQGTQIQGARSRGSLDFVWWHLIFVGPQ